MPFRPKQVIKKSMVVFVCVFTLIEDETVWLCQLKILTGGREREQRSWYFNLKCSETETVTNQLWAEPAISILSSHSGRLCVRVTCLFVFGIIQYSLCSVSRNSLFQWSPPSLVQIVRPCLVNYPISSSLSPVYIFPVFSLCLGRFSFGFGLSCVVLCYFSK